jgi:ribosome-binding protein aMBF1 (putative translation factor)
MCTQNEYMRKTITTNEYSQLIASLKNRRQSLGWSMRELAEKLGESHSFVQRVEDLERRLDVFEYTVYCAVLELDPLVGIRTMVSSQEKGPA